MNKIQRNKKDFMKKLNKFRDSEHQEENFLITSKL